MRTHLVGGLLALVLTGCAAAPQNAQVAVAGTATTSPAEQATSPDAAVGEVIETPDRLVRVVKPRGEGWQCQQDQVTTPVRASLIGCSKQVGDDKLTLLAKDYVVLVEGEILSAKEIAAGVYLRQWQRTLQDVEVKRSAAVEHAGHPWYEVELEGNFKGGRDHVFERVAVVGRHTIVVQAIGRATTFAALREEIADWFEQAAFASLAGASTGEKRA